ncbi:hypothetical protein NDU88_002366, partial [Pleurodeles waltl]
LYGMTSSGSVAQEKFSALLRGKKKVCKHFSFITRLYMIMWNDQQWQCCPRDVLCITEGEKKKSASIFHSSHAFI